MAIDPENLNSIDINDVPISNTVNDATDYVLGVVGNMGKRIPLSKIKTIGPTGATGATGEDGVTPTLSVGTVTTGAAGSSASVTMSGAAPDYVLNFAIPKGDTGDTGASGSGSEGGVVFQDSYVGDANSWLTNGYTKTKADTRNLPAVCTNTKDKWGILFFIAENATNGTGTQTFYPIDGTYMGKVFTRSIVNGTKETIRTTEWSMFVTEDSIVSRETSLAKVAYASSVNITDLRSYINVTGDITITLPDYSRRYTETNAFTYEHHVYMNFTSAHTVTFNDTIKWQSFPTIKDGVIVDFIFNFVHADSNTNFWLGGAVVYE